MLVYLAKLEGRTEATEKDLLDPLKENIHPLAQRGPRMAFAPKLVILDGAFDIHLFQGIPKAPLEGLEATAERPEFRGNSGYVLLELLVVFE